jgi:hypothetical protein
VSNAIAITEKCLQLLRGASNKVPDELHTKVEELHELLKSRVFPAKKQKNQKAVLELMGQGFSK